MEFQTVISNLIRAISPILAKRHICAEISIQTENFVYQMSNSNGNSIEFFKSESLRNFKISRRGTYHFKSDSMAFCVTLISL